MFFESFNAQFTKYSYLAFFIKIITTIVLNVQHKILLRIM
ncbi:hypothetical protein CYJ66_02265 [Gardnerella vaginalis]|uniref:Uncharacterized protein n=1 Tax=Gardnerella vaginalis (strain ATCC 14019 / 317) TaxID=525284 RepID=E3D9S0_GARV3|nr:hypothetical protein HMPREF0421_20732 [Gardnerella vaginalis ATCC 14019]PKZ47096.1 hypothetical protein CYJ67_04650 [Gardnerella vaginalis]TCH81868.1 hypothetical protein E0E46_05365 [Gardnerella vaginalis ATCC 14018 = JCM 11026]PKZ53611.1 hypothetical protein CYJ66_02265 [Gardnerella vaginalis]PKZ55721.1 hypothetical protein CYJ64_02265 [Gardnerella vaginalis]